MPDQEDDRAEQAAEARGRLCELLGLDADSPRGPIVLMPGGRGLAMFTAAAQALLDRVEALAEGACQPEPTPRREWAQGVGVVAS